MKYLKSRLMKYKLIYIGTIRISKFNTFKFELLDNKKSN